MKLGTLFPGQGSQYPGMNKVLLENFPFTKTVFEEASDALNENLTRLCLDGPQEKLQLTENAQPCILVTSFAWFTVLAKELSLKPAAGGGHSLGEYSALLSAGALSLADAVRLVRKRGALMQSAVPVGKGKMAAILGLEDELVVALCAKASEGNSVVVAANFNAPSQVVIAGNSEAVDRAQKLAEGEGEWRAKKVIPLQVSAPFHSPLMKKVGEGFSPFLKETTWKGLSFPVVSNVDAVLRSKGDWASLLTSQIDHPVLWTQCAQTLEKEGLEVFVEMGPGQVLTGLVKRSIKKAKLFGLDTLEAFKKFEKAFREGFSGT